MRVYHFEAGQIYTELTASEVALANQIGCLRYKRAVTARAKQIGVQDSGPSQHIWGVLGEIVMSRYLGVPFKDLTYSAAAKRGSDVELPGRVQVRTRSQGHHQLNQRKDRVATDQPYVLLTPESPVELVLRGWARGSELAGLAGPPPYRGADHSLWIPQEMLRPMEPEPIEEFYAR